MGIPEPKNINKSWWWRLHPGKGGQLKQEETLFFSKASPSIISISAIVYWAENIPSPKTHSQFTPENQWLLQMMHLRLEMVTFQGQTRGKHRPLLMHLDEPVVWTPSRPGTWHAYLLRDFSWMELRKMDILDDDCRFCTFLNWETKDFDFYEAMLCLVYSEFKFSVPLKSCQCIDTSHGMHWHVRLCLIVHQTRRTCGTNEQVRCMQTSPTLHRWSKFILQKDTRIPNTLVWKSSTTTSLWSFFRSMMYFKHEISLNCSAFVHSPSAHNAQMEGLVPPSWRGKWSSS